jgi:hypothetical protein
MKLFVLRQPYPLETSGREILKYAIISGIVVFAFMFMVRPLGMFEQVPVRVAFLVSLVMGAFCVAWVFVAFRGLGYLFPAFYREEAWNLGKHLFAFFIVITGMAATASFLNHFLWQTPLSLKLFVVSEYYSLIIAMAPIFVVTLLKQRMLLIRYEEEAKRLSAEIKDHTPALSDNREITLYGENRQEELKVMLSDLLFIKAADNYVEVMVRKDDRIKAYLLRSSLKKISEAVNTLPVLYRCHRSYLVNLSHIEKITGSAQGCMLSLKGSESPVPVSRSLNKELKQKLKDL